MHKVRLLIVGAFPGENRKIYGGIARSCYMLLKSPTMDRFDVDLLDSSQLSNPAPIFPIRAIFAMKRLLLLVYKLLFRRFDTALIFSSDGASAIEKGIMIWVCHLFKRPVLIFPRAGNLINQTSKSPAMLSLVKFFYSRSTIFLCQGLKWKEYAVKQLKLREPNIKIVHNWTATERQLAIGCDRRFYTGQKVRLVFVGWIERSKGVFELLQACRNLHNRGIPFHLTFVGGGSIVGTAKRFVSKYHLDENIDFYGWADSTEVENILEDSDVFVLPSWSEGLPNAMIEAMAAKLATVVTSVGVISDYVEDGRHSIVIPPKNTEALEHALERVITQKEVRENIASNGYQLALESFSVQENTKKLGDIIQAVSE